MIVRLAAAALLLAATPTPSVAEDDGEPLKPVIAPEAPEQIATGLIAAWRSTIGAGPIDLQVTAEGAAVAIAGDVRAWIETVATRAGLEIVSGGSDLRLRLRLRFDPQEGRLAGLADFHGKDASTRFSKAFDVPVSRSLSRYLGIAVSESAASIVAQLDGEVLDVCGADPDHDGVADVVLVTAREVRFCRWQPEGFTVVRTAPIPVRLRPRIRTGGLTITCDEAQKRAWVSSPSRATAASVGWSGADVEWSDVPAVPAAGLAPVGPRGQLPVRLADARLALSDVASTKPPLACSRRIGEPLVVATVTVAAGRERRLVSTLPVFVEPAASDRFVVHRDDDPCAVEFESGPVSGAILRLAVVKVGAWERVLGITMNEGRSELVAFGPRSAGGEP